MKLSNSKSAHNQIKSLFFIFLLYFVLTACNDNSTPHQDSGFEFSQVTKEYITSQYGDFLVKKYQVEGGNVHTSYIGTNTYLSTGKFLFITDVKGVALYLKSNDHIYKITESLTGQDIYADSWSFGLSATFEDGEIFYLKNNAVYSYSLTTKSNNIVFDTPKGYQTWAPLRVDYRKEKFSLTLTKDGKSFLFIFDIFEPENNALIESPFYGTSRPTANHSNINPQYNMLMFSHDGSWVRDRIWFYDLSNKSVKRIYLQEKYVELGHESWFNNGDNLFAVQYGSPTRGIKSGIIEFDVVNLLPNYYLSDSYYLSHAAIIEGSNCYVADTNRINIGDEQFKVVLFNKLSMEFIELYDVKFSSHPAHPHPIVSNDGNSIIFNNVNDDGNIEIIEINLKDIMSSGFCSR